MMRLPLYFTSADFIRIFLQCCMIYKHDIFSAFQSVSPGVLCHCNTAPGKDAVRGPENCTRNNVSCLYRKECTYSIYLNKTKL